MMSAIYVIHAKKFSCFTCGEEWMNKHMDVCEKTKSVKAMPQCPVAKEDDNL